jgi:protein-S-isoprenylcysteine O-methyltransferase Ste14
MIYDVLMRLPFTAWVLTSAAVQTAGLIHMGVAPIHLLMRASTIAFLLLLAAAVILRTRPTANVGGLEPRISAIAGTCLMYGVLLFPRLDLSASAEVIATLLIMVGNVGAIAALSQLGRSFSVMAESRELVTSGPYRFVRHPLYAAEELAMIGLFMQFASIWTALIFAAQIAFQLRRMLNEEAVLTASFPEYCNYQQITARLIPWIY